MGRVAFSALLTGIGDGVHGYEVLRHLPARLGNDLFAVVGTGEFFESLLGERPPEGVDLKAIPVRGAMSRLLFELRSHRMLKRAGEVDALYLRFRSFALLPYLYARRRRVPLVVEVNGIPALELEGRGLKRLLLALTRPIDRRLLRSAHVVVVDYAMLDLIRNHYGIEVEGTHIPNGIDAAAFRPMDRNAARADLSLPGGRIVMFVGALEPWQGIENLVDAFASLDKEDMSLVIVGDGPLRADLERRAPEGAIFTGRVPYSQVPRYINAADVCVVPIPPARPNFPLKAREALACGVPLLVTENDSARELRDIAPGSLIPDNSPRSIAEGIERILNDPGTPDASRRAREFILERYSWDTAMERVVAVIDRMRNA